MSGDELDGSGGPRVAYTASPLQKPGYYETYAEALRRAGGSPVPVAPGDRVDPQDFEGLLLPGGWDVEPQRYGQAPDPRLTKLDPALDELEISLARRFREERRPILGICRGLQVLNVAFGGSLIQHVDGHDARRIGRRHLAHPVSIRSDTRLSRLAGTAELAVNSLHHQAIDRVAPGLVVSAVDPEGTVEGMESGDGLIMAVQCHPEELIGGSAWAARLFADFVARAAAVKRFTAR